MAIVPYRAGTPLREDMVLHCVQHHPTTPRDLARFLAKPFNEVNAHLRALHARGVLHRSVDGVYAGWGGGEGDNSGT